MIRCCYVTDVEDSCHQPARYEAWVTYTEGLMLLCEDHALQARGDRDVIAIRFLRDCGPVSEFPNPNRVDSSP